MTQRRRNSHIEGLATHDDPESCGHSREGVSEALTGAHAGRVLSREIEIVPGAESVFKVEGNTGRSATREERQTWRGRRPRACVEASGARTGRPCTPPWRMAPWAAVGSPRTRATDARGRESDCCVVPAKLLNKGEGGGSEELWLS